MTYAKIVGGLAVVICVAAPASAATMLAKNSVTKRAIAANAVTSPKVRNGSLRRVDVAAAALQPTGLQGMRGPAGDPGPVGDRGPRGAAGADAASSVPEWVWVKGGGGAWAMKRFVSVSRLSAGVWDLNFYIDLDGCVVVPTISQFPDTASLVIPPGTIGLRVTGPATARVDTYGADGNHLDRDFFVMVQC